MVTNRIWSGCGGTAALELGQCRGWAAPGLTPKHHFLPSARYLRGETAGKNTSSHQSSHFLLLQESWSAAIDITDHFLPGKNLLSAETLPFPPLIPHWQGCLCYTLNLSHIRRRSVTSHPHATQTLQKQNNSHKAGDLQFKQSAEASSKWNKWINQDTEVLQLDQLRHSTPNLVPLKVNKSWWFQTIIYFQLINSKARTSWNM